ncbi:MAG: hypothetical protein PHD70_03445 [Anaerostipes sp.]|jgi:hypothetical protein|nr:hypothetical protein [Anaerostipes sp.]MDD3745515.1 hypothetical protein [Anaerostipes sp.]
MKNKRILSVEELMKKSVTFALAATLLAGTSNLSVIKEKIKVSENANGRIVIEQRG